MKALFPFLKLWRRHSWQLFFGIILAALTLLASVGLLSLSGWFLAASAMAGSAGIYSFNYMLPAAGVRGAAILRTVARYLERLVSHDATFKVLKHLRVAIFSKIYPLAPAGTQEFRQGDLLNRFVGDVETLDHLYLRVISPMIGAVLVAVVVGIGLSYINVSAAVFVALVMLAVIVLFPPIFYRLGKSAGEQIAALSSAYRQQLTTNLSAMSELLLFPPAKDWRMTLSQTEQKWQATQARQQSLNAMAQSIILFLTGITVVVVFIIMSRYQVEQVATADSALLIFCVLAAFEALGPVAIAFLHLSEVSIAAERLHQLIQQAPKVTFPDTAVPCPEQDANLSLNAVNFRYSDTGPQVLNQLTLHLAAKQKVALLGSTGCGKTTLLQLLTRAWDPQAGEIQLNHQPLQAYSEQQLRSLITVVSQRVSIFNQTLRENLTLAKPNANDHQLADSLVAVGLDNLLEGAGLDSWLGEGGRPLSGGERRRLAIARALLHNAPLWLLDEPLEGLDAQTEHQIMQLLLKVTADKTVLMVTHRLTGIESLDTICVMDQGQIIEQGSHEDLIAQQGRYFAFRVRQKSQQKL
ncbi:cysteine/glutathione ABC transporter ATP-binding protein/permease CydC [Rosenbergiella australiborealis]|uniref:ABC-type xenobiotic transporter n=1 Tax=Rosenbergiella australiborealis TaxID=1544696 RepID=A0ABS5T3R8_9GAMM|nr:cysteine/glutathione ABC transporter ATP-binding protein/permease CydC [Rosenbergiella australiborealis]MBT0726971.1 cysteine/glutathione ABC transporter ATP-binding protein/permease CydC [Rosenbergiella australiborealis]